MQIHPDSPNFFQSSEEIAARKIQAGFRGYRVRKQLKTRINTKNTHRNNNKTNIINNNNCKLNKKMNGNLSKETGTIKSTAITDTLRNDHDNYHHELSPASSISSSTIEDKCATKIQAGIRGYLVRKRQKREQEAATKIQANFRGFKVRKELQKIKK